MIVAISLYGIISSLVLSIRSNTVFNIIQRKSCLWVSLLLPFFFLDPNKLYFYFPLVVVVGYRILFTAVKNELVEFFIIYLVTLATLNQSLIWLVAVIILLKYSVNMHNDQNSDILNSSKFEVGHILDIILLSTSLVFMTFTHFYFGNSNNLQLTSLISLFLLAFFVYKSMGVIGPVYLKKLELHASFEDRILTDTISMLVIPLVLISSIKDIVSPLIIESSDYVLISFALLYGMIAYVFQSTGKANFVQFLRLIYSTSFTCTLFAYIYTSNFELYDVILFNTISFILYILGNIVDQVRVPYKKSLFILIIALMLPTFINPIFYKNILTFNVILEQAGFKVGLFFITILLLPFAFVVSSFEKIIKSTGCVRIKGIDVVKLLYWIIFLVFAYVAVYYGKV